MDRISVKALFERALVGGARQLSPFECEWNIAERCLMPVRREIYARKGQGFSITKVRRTVSSSHDVEDTFHDWLEDDPLTINYGSDKHGPYCILLTVKCRMCDQCLKERRDLWTARAAIEFHRANRVWFGTLTINPEWQSRFGFFAAELCRKRRREELEIQPLDTQLHYRHQAAAVEITKMWKRLRKAGHRFRYFLVLEAHKTMLPHYHCLVFEQAGPPIAKRTLEAEWEAFGFSQWRLATDMRAVRYAAKYLGKSSAARVRASLNFGSVGRALAVASEAKRENSSSSREEAPASAPLRGSLQIFEKDLFNAPLESLAVAASDRAPT